MLGRRRSRSVGKNRSKRISWIGRWCGTWSTSGQRSLDVNRKLVERIAHGCSVQYVLVCKKERLRILSLAKYKAIKLFSVTTKTIEAELIMVADESSSEIVAICSGKRMTLDFTFDQNALDFTVASRIVGCTHVGYE